MKEVKFKANKAEVKALDERVTALEEGGGGGVNRQTVKVSVDQASLLPLVKGEVNYIVTYSSYFNVSNGDAYHLALGAASTSETYQYTVANGTVNLIYIPIIQRTGNTQARIALLIFRASEPNPEATTASMSSRSFNVLEL